MKPETMARNADRKPETAIDDYEMSRGFYLAAGADLRRFRMKAGFSLRKLGLKLSLSAAYLCDIENGRLEISAELVRRYLEALRTEPVEVNGINASRRPSL